MLSWGRSDLCFCWCMAFPFFNIDISFFVCTETNKLILLGHPALSHVWS